MFFQFLSFVGFLFATTKATKMLRGVLSRFCQEFCIFVLQHKCNLFLRVVGFIQFNIISPNSDLILDISLEFMLENILARFLVLIGGFVVLSLLLTVINFLSRFDKGKVPLNITIS